MVDPVLLLPPGRRQLVQLVQAPLALPARKVPTWAAAAQEANLASAAGLVLVP